MAFFRKRLTRLKFTLVILLPLFWTGCGTSPSPYGIPSKIDPESRYLFFLHGMIMEKGGPYSVHSQHGPYDYYGIVRAFEERGFRVISEIRPSGTEPRRYAEKVAQQVKTLLGAGIPPAHTTVAGFSKGGVIAFFVSARLEDPGVNFVVMAGCAREGPFQFAYARVLRGAAPYLKGRFLSIYDADDRVAGTCQKAFQKAPKGISTEEIEVRKGLGHGLFYRPYQDWVAPVVDWIDSIQQ